MLCPVTVLCRKLPSLASRPCKNSSHASTCQSFNSAVNWRGTHLVKILLNCRTLWVYDMLIHDGSYFIHCYTPIFLHNDFSCCNGLWCYYSLCMTWSKRIRYRSDAICKHPTPFLHLFQWQTYITILNFHFRWISVGFIPSLHKKRTTEHCSSLVHVYTDKRSCHLYTDN